MEEELQWQVRTKLIAEVRNEWTEDKPTLNLVEIIESTIEASGRQWSPGLPACLPLADGPREDRRSGSPRPTPRVGVGVTRSTSQN